MYVIVVEKGFSGNSILVLAILRAENSSTYQLFSPQSDASDYMQGCQRLALSPSRGMGMFKYYICLPMHQTHPQGDDLTKINHMAQP